MRIVGLKEMVEDKYSWRHGSPTYIGHAQEHLKIFL